MEAVSLSLNTPVGRIYKAERGKGGATFAHWQIAIAYAKYLSPDFQMWCNSVVRGHMEGKAVSISGNWSPKVLEVIERNLGITRMLARKVTEIEGMVADMQDSVLEAMVKCLQTAAMWRHISGKSIVRC